MNCGQYQGVADVFNHFRDFILEKCTSYPALCKLCPEISLSHFGAWPGDSATVIIQQPRSSDIL